METFAQANPEGEQGAPKEGANASADRFREEVNTFVQYDTNSELSMTPQLVTDYQPSANHVPGTIAISGLVGGSLRMHSICRARIDVFASNAASKIATMVTGNETHLTTPSRFLQNPLGTNAFAARDAVFAAGSESRLAQTALQDATLTFQGANGSLLETAQQYRLPRTADLKIEHTGPKAELFSSRLSGAEGDLFRRKHLFFEGSASSHVGYDGVKANAYIGTADEVLKPGSTKMFVAGSAEATMLQQLESSRAGLTSASMRAREAEAAFASKSMQYATAESRLMQGSATEHFAGGAGRGMLYSAVSLAGGYTADKIISNRMGTDVNPISNPVNLLVDGIGTPAVLLSDLPGKYKIPTAIAMFGLARAANAYWAPKK